MANVMADMYASSREAPLPHKRRSTRQSMRCTQPSNPPSSARRSARINKSKSQSEKGVADSEPFENEEETESEEGVPSEEEDLAACEPLRVKGKITHSQGTSS